ncbi:MAG: hypothetical protein EBT60_01825 [Bacteroidetes bacterium]|nr:hypothetical protein [Bacteroidota bacterium]
MINRLKDPGLLTLLLVVLVAIAIRIPALWFIPPEAVISKPGMLATLVAWINSMPVFSVIVSLVMVVALAFMINEMVRSHAMMRPVGYLPAYFFILLQSIYLENMLVTEYHFGNFFVFLGLILLLRLRDGYSTVLLFYSAMAFGIAILIVPDHLLILLFVLSCVLVFKTIVIRDVLAIVFGLILPYYVLRSLIFINGWDVSAGNYFSDNVEVRRGKLVVILFFVYSLLLLALHWRELKSFHLLTAFPAAILIAYFFTGEKRYWWKELMGWGLLMGLVATLYFV